MLEGPPGGYLIPDVRFVAHRLFPPGPSYGGYPELVMDSSLVLSIRSHCFFKLGLLILVSFVVFHLFFQLGQNFDSPQTHLPYHHQRPVLGWPWLYSDEKPCILCTPYHASSFCLIVASVATPCFSQEPRVQSVFSRLRLTNYRIIKVGYVQACITVPIPDVEHRDLRAANPS